ncbi:MAG: hypothetical protein KA257_00250 [Opitutaceae bacterium]|nr:hypothetical protein [Opitutaceae bacterium]
MENFAPGLREAVLGLTNSLRVIVFFVCVLGLMLHLQQARGDIESLTRPLLRATVIVALLATLPHWFGFTERIFLSIADTVHAGYTQHPMETAAKMRAAVADGGSDFSLRRVGESVYQALLWAAAKLIVLNASLLQLPFLLLQFILKLLCYLFLPVALGLFMIPALSQLATRYIQQTLAVLAWPVGFAVTELVAYHLLTAYLQNQAVLYGLQPGEINAASFASVLGALLASLWLIIGTIGTPFLMQGLICSGAPMSGGGQTAMQQLYAVQQIAFMLKSLKTAGAAAPVMAAQATSKAGGSMPPPPPPSQASPPPPGPATPPAAPAGHADPTGDHTAAVAISSFQLPVAQRGI